MINLLHLPAIIKAPAKFNLDAELKIHSSVDAGMGEGDRNTATVTSVTPVIPHNKRNACNSKSPTSNKSVINQKNLVIVLYLGQ